MSAWLLGCLFSRTSSGKQPFLKKRPMKRIKRQSQVLLPSLNLVNPDCPKMLPPSSGKGELFLWSRRAPNSTETQKELKWPKSDSKVTPADRPQSDPKLAQKWLRTPFFSHFWVTFESLGITLKCGLGSHFWVTLGSLLGNFDSFWVSVELGAKTRLISIQSRLSRCWASVRASQLSQPLRMTFEHSVF